MGGVVLKMCNYAEHFTLHKIYLNALIYNTFGVHLECRTLIYIYTYNPSVQPISDPKTILRAHSNTLKTLYEYGGILNELWLKYYPTKISPECTHVLLKFVQHQFLRILLEFFRISFDLIFLSNSNKSHIIRIPLTFHKKEK